jgi:eukaryotic-like serine/threonine-protein kinase
MKPLFRFAMLALSLFVVALVSAITAMQLAIHGQEVQIPAIVGMTPLEAERSIAGLGLQMEVERQYYSPQIPEGRIMTQLPQPGTKVRRGWQVRVALSMGPQRVSIPDVTKQSPHAAELNIRRRGLEVSSTAEIRLAGSPPDQVLAQSPPANASQVAAPKTSLLVTVPTDPRAYVMPAFAGQTLGSASRALQDAGFKLGSVSVSASEANAGAPSPEAVPAAPVPISIIVGQTPPPGQKVLAGAVVNFEVR